MKRNIFIKLAYALTSLVMKPKGDDEDRAEFDSPDFSALGVDLSEGDKQSAIEEAESQDEIIEEVPGHEEGSGPEHQDDSKAAAEEPKEDDSEPKPQEEEGNGETDEATGEGNKPESEESDPSEHSDLDEIQVSPRARPEVKQGFGALKEKIKSERAEKKLIQAELEQFKAEVEALKSKQPEIPESMIKEVNEMREFFYAHNIEKNPEFIEKYSKPAAEGAESLVKQLQAISGNTLPQQIADNIASKGASSYPDGWWEALLNKLPRFQRAAVESQLVKQLGLEASRDSAKKEMSGNAEKYVKLQEEQTQKQVQEWSAAAHQEGMKIMQEEGDWVKEKQIPENASPEVKRQIEEHNNKLKGYVQKITDYVNAVYTRDPVSVTRAGFAMFKAEHLKAENEAITKERESLKAEVDELRKELGKIKQSGRVASQKVAAPPKKATDDRIMSTAEALEKEFGYKVGA